MKIYKFPDEINIEDIIKRPSHNTISLATIVKEVFSKVEQEGDQGIFYYTKKFDKIDSKSILISEIEMDRATNDVEPSLRIAIQKAYDNIRKFHFSQREEIKVVETTDGVSCWRESKPIQKVGLYIPGGTAPLFSTVLMLGVPSQIAGCEEVVLCTPPDSEGNIHPAILFAANLCGINKIAKIGGIQAIAALSLGTESIPKTDKIFGPGNQYVTSAKMYAQQLGIAIDMPAGPSEVLIIADQTSIPSFVASDLLAQAEHGIDSQVVLLTWDINLSDEVLKCMEDQLVELPRKDITIKALENSKIILVDNAKEALEISNHYAPEHLILAVENESFFLEGIINAGSVFIGNYTPESAGDYASGTNHTLPTNGFAKSYSGVSLDSFFKKITFQKITTNGLRNLGNTIEVMARHEHLEAHKNAVTIRLKYMDENKI
jgi:histidinol dehydrogenase